MRVSVHQAVGAWRSHPKRSTTWEEQGVTLQPMPLVHHDVLLGIASAGDMIDGTGEMTLPAASYGESQVETG